MTPRRALSVTALVLVVLGVALLAWAVAPEVPGVDAPAVITDAERTGSPGSTFPADAFLALEDPGNRYRVEIRASEHFVLGERRADRPDDPIREHGARGQNAGGTTTYVVDLEFVSTIEASNPANPTQGPKEFYIRFPEADGNVDYQLTVSKIPVLAQPLVWAKAWASILGVTIGGAGLVLYVLRAALPRPKPAEDVADDADEGAA